MILIYLDGYIVERAFTPGQLANALDYWRSYGVVTTMQSPNLITLH